MGSGRYELLRIPSRRMMLCVIEFCSRPTNRRNKNVMDSQTLFLNTIMLSLKNAAYVKRSVMNPRRHLASVIYSTHGVIRFDVEPRNCAFSLAQTEVSCIDAPVQTWTYCEIFVRADTNEYSVLIELTLRCMNMFSADVRAYYILVSLI